jgi:hypothetical protein
MGHSNSILVVHSPDPRGDALSLQNIFPTLQRQPHDEHQILLGDDDGSCILLIPAKLPLTVAWVVSDSTIQRIRSEPTVFQIQEFAALAVRLPSGSSILMITSDTLATNEGRAAVAKFLSHDSGYDAESNGSSQESKEVALTSQPKDPNLPSFPTLSVKLLQQKGSWDSPFCLNSREPIEFETDLFKGKILVVVRPEKLDDDPFWSKRIFSKKKRRIVLNVQGKFKRKPEGTVFLGAEITKPMKLGLFTRGILGMLVRLMEGFFTDLRYSLGDSAKKLSPRVVTPAHSAFERLVVTPEGEDPPPITGDPFEESKEDRAKRIKEKQWEWNEKETYSFSFFSMYLSLVDWNLVNLPVSPDINLRRLWSDSDLRIVLYENKGKMKEHTASSINYAFNLNVRYHGNKLGEESNEPEDFEDIALDGGRHQSYDEEGAESGYDSNLTRSESTVFPVLMEADSSDEDDFYDADERSSAFRSVNEISLTPSEAVELLATIDRLVPAWIVVASGKGTYVRTFALNHGSKTCLFSAHDCEEYMNSIDSDVIRERIEDHFSPRISLPERSRRCLGLLLKDGGETFDNIEERAAPFTDYFLRRTEPKVSDRLSTIMCGFAARAVSDRHWEEEWMILSTNGRLTLFHPEKRKIRLRISFSNVLKVSALREDQAPLLPNFGFICIETLGRCIYLMFSSSSVRDDWLAALSNLQSSSAIDEMSQDTDNSRRLLDTDQPQEEFLHKSTMWNCKHRRILNSGLFNLRCTTEVENPLDIVREALRLSIDAFKDESGERRRLFFQSAGTLKRARVHVLSEDGRLAFFLNLYHTMVMHAYLVLGTPGSGLKWISFFNNLAYEVGDDLFSVSELEHCIIRAEMAKPSQFISRFVIPKAHYPMALQKADFRINFALNPGSLSNPPSILVYSPDMIDQQLDLASSMYLETASVTAKGSQKDVVVQLPRICQWFLEDFGSQEDLLNKIEPYLKSEEQLTLRQARMNNQNALIRFSDFNFKCRPLTLTRVNSKS